jgi:hypothetical protein
MVHQLGPDYTVDALKTVTRLLGPINAVATSGLSAATLFWEN